MPPAGPAPKVNMKNFLTAVAVTALTITSFTALAHDPKKVTTEKKVVTEKKEATGKKVATDKKVVKDKKIATITTTTAHGKSDAPDLSKLLDPSKLTATAPDVFLARFETSKGPFVIEVHREWSPRGADRFYNLVSNGFYDGARFFRVISGFMAQFGINANPKVSEVWKEARIDDDPVKQSNTRGMVSFAMAGKDTRTTQLFINYVDTNARLDGMGFSPFGNVVEGMDVVDALHSAYGEGAPRGAGPSQDRIQGEGNTYLDAEYPLLDSIKSARIVKK
jgi:peptidyl-prolyl cis-trans isomerase A (cyclophilin A)